MEKDPYIQPEHDDFFVVQMTPTTQDTLTLYDQEYYYTDQEGRGSRQRINGLGNIAKYGLVIKSQNFVQLNNAFPFYARKHRFFFSFSETRMVKGLSKRMDKFYQKAILTYNDDS